MNNNFAPFKPKIKKITVFDVYFDSNGDLSRSNSYWSTSDHKEPNAVFYDTLVYSGYNKFRNSVFVLFASQKTGRTLSMFMSDFNDVIMSGLFINQTIKGKFCFVKKGLSQGVRYFFEPET